MSCKVNAGRAVWLPAYAFALSAWLISGCGRVEAAERARAQSEAALAKATTALHTAQGELATLRGRVNALEQEAHQLRTQLQKESPNAWYAVIASMEPGPEWADAARDFIRVHGNANHARTLQVALTRWSDAEEERGQIAKLATVTMSDVYAAMAAYQGKVIERNFDCYAPSVDDAMMGQLGIVAHRLQLPHDAEEYGFRAFCHVVGEDTPDVGLFLRSEQLKSLPAPSGMHYTFIARAKILVRHGAGVALALVQ